MSMSIVEAWEHLAKGGEFQREYNITEPIESRDPDEDGYCKFRSPGPTRVIGQYWQDASRADVFKVLEESKKFPNQTHIKDLRAKVVVADVTELRDQLEALYQAHKDTRFVCKDMSELLKEYCNKFYTRINPTS